MSAGGVSSRRVAEAVFPPDRLQRQSRFEREQMFENENGNIWREDRFENGSRGQFGGGGSRFPGNVMMLLPDKRCMEDGCAYDPLDIHGRAWLHTGIYALWQVG